MIEGITREGIPNQSYLTGMGYIVIPSDADRDKYIETCYRTERVSIHLDDGGSVIQDCYIDQSKLQQIKFPKDYKGLGSIVVYICDRFVRKPIIVGVLSDRGSSQLIEENSFQKVVRSENGVVSIEGKGKDGSLFINVESEVEAGGSVYVNLKSLNNKGKFDVKCFGDINLYSEGETSLNALKTITATVSYVEGLVSKVASMIELSQDGLLYEDKNENRIEAIGGEVNIIPKTRMNIFEGSQPMVKGSELKTQLDISKTRLTTVVEALKSSVSLLPTSCAAFGAAITTAMATLVVKEDYSNINSTKSFTD